MREQMDAIGRAARDASDLLRTIPAAQRSEAIRAIAARIRRRVPEILEANARDVADATAMIDRLTLNEHRVEDMARALDAIADLPDPVGTVLDRWVRPNGLEISRVRTPIGVIGMIYESRPNVTADAAAICLRSGNAVILRSGSEALRSALAIGAAIADGLAAPACRQAAYNWFRQPTARQSR